MVTGRDMLVDLYDSPRGDGEHNLYSMLGVTYAGGCAGLIKSLETVASDPLTGSFAPNPIKISGLVLDYGDPTTGPATTVAL